MPVEMTRVRLIGFKTDLLPAMETLRKSGLVHVEDVSELEDMAVKPLQLEDNRKHHRTRLERLLAEIEGQQEALGCPSDDHSPAEADDYVNEAEKEIGVVSARIAALDAREEKLDAEEASLPRYKATLEKLLPDIPQEAADEDRRTIGIMIKRKNRDVLEILRTQVSDISQGLAEFTSRKIDEDTQGMLIVFPDRYAEPVEALLGEKDVTRLRLPAEFEGSRPTAMLETIRDRLAAIPEERRELEDARAEFHEAWCPRLGSWASAARKELARYRILDRLGETDSLYVLVGWTPAADFRKLEQVFADDFGERALVEEIPIPEEIEDRIPVILENPKPVRPFESLVHLLSSPTYRGLDPTWLMAVFLPLLFGMILGDAGYGIVLLALCLALMRRFRVGFAADLIRVLAYGSGWSIVFGVLYGEAFGTLGETLGMHPILFHRGGEEVTSLLLLSVGVGAAHILIGLLIGVWTAARHRDRSELLERGGMLIGLVALMVLSGVVAGVLPEGLMTPAIAGVVVGVAVLGSSMGWLGLLVGPIEFLSLIGNVLSYLRIAAIGLASVYLAQVANDLAGSIGVLVVGILIAILIHALNIALGAFSPTIHALRLHYVEFFRKFYEGGGRRFEPYR